MKMIESIKSVGQTARDQAVESLKAALHQVSQIKLKHIDFDSPRPDLKVDILAHVEVHGRSHTLVCKVEASGRPDHVRTALEALCKDAARFSGNSTPVLIAPHVSPEAQALCKANATSFLDLEGNARLHLGEVFIGKRSQPQSKRSTVQLAGVA